MPWALAHSRTSLVLEDDEDEDDDEEPPQIDNEVEDAEIAEDEDAGEPVRDAERSPS
jgi:hypothetical protein